MKFSRKEARLRIKIEAMTYGKETGKAWHYYINSSLKYSSYVEHTKQGLRLFKPKKQ